MKNPAIVVIAYNREKALKRLLSSLLKADYKEGENVTLIISIDKGDNKEVIAAAEFFEWPYGEKIVITQPENLGLKAHVLKCGDLTEKYENIIMLEDDLYVSRSFYEYTKDALFFVEDNDKVAGVALYNHLFNVNVREPFEAIDDGYDNYYLQFACSWGQAFSVKQWRMFKAWLSVNDLKDLHSSDMPEFVSSWSDKSWLKYCIKYVIETGKYFIYPRVSLTTNFADEGTHETESATNFQVALAGKKKRKYVFSSLNESESVYDAFFESKVLESKLNDTEIDLYGSKPVLVNKYLLSSKAYPYKVIKKFGRKLRPLDANILDETEGGDFFLYDTKQQGEVPKINEAERVLYNYRAINVKKMSKVISYRIFGK